MAFKQSYSKPVESSTSNSFAGKYGLKKIAGMDKVGTECFIIPLDMQSGYSVLPYHALKKNGSDGFKGSRFNSQIACHRFNPETGEMSEELPLCCKLAQIEKDREPEKERSGYRAISFTNYRNVIPVLVLSTSEAAGKKPSLRNISLNGIDFSFLNLAKSSYEEELQKKVIKDMEKAGLLDDPDGMDPEELLGEVQKYLQHSIIRVTNEAGKAGTGIEYQKSFTIFPVSTPNIAKDSGETELISRLCQLLSGEINPAKFDAFFKKYPQLQAINNQVTDFLTLFNNEVDSLITEWTDEELQKYYNSFVDKQAQIQKYKDVNENNRAAEEEEVNFVSQDDPEPAKAIKVEVDEDDFATDEITLSDDEDFGFEAPSTEAKKAPKKELVGAVASSKSASASTSSDFNTADLEESSVLDEIDDLDDSDFESEEDDFGFEG